MKIKMKFSSVLMGHCSLVDQDGVEIENAQFVNFNGEKEINGEYYIYAMIILPLDDYIYKPAEGEEILT